MTDLLLGALRLEMRPMSTYLLLLLLLLLLFILIKQENNHSNFRDLSRGVTTLGCFFPLSLEILLKTLYRQTLDRTS